MPRPVREVEPPTVEGRIPPGSFLESALTAGEQSRVRREVGYILPLERGKDGRLRFARPGIVDDIVKAITLPGDVAAGRVDPMGQEAIERGFDLAGTVTLGGGFASAPASSLRMSMARNALKDEALPGVGYKLEDVAKTPVPKRLRERYRSTLSDAADGKDPMRIKLTPERVEKAKAGLKESIDTWHSYRTGENKWGDTEQMRNAKAFAEEMVRRGEKVSFKMPDGERGSIYVRVGKKGTVRFSDHPQPMEGDKIVGGYSKTLGRRHKPAQHSVAPKEATLEDVLRAYGAK
jgi:hypothetical protein